MILDGHIHLMDATQPREPFLQQLAAGGAMGGLLISLPPDTFIAPAPALPFQRRLDHLLRWVDGQPLLFPFFWIDPLEEDALGQVAMAAPQVAGFKVICDRYFPWEARPLEVFAAIAQIGKPILFHSGILWDGKASSRYNRPAEFEALLTIPGLRFSLAHISWPWCDELIAVYGKYAAVFRSRAERAAEMFIDLTPGTPPIYRRDALTKLLTVGYDVWDNLIFGTDSLATPDIIDVLPSGLARDRQIFTDLGVSEERQAKIFGGNLRRFVGAG